MENNILNALEFLLKDDPQAQEGVDNGYDIARLYSDKEWLSKMVAYASQVSPKIVLPARKEIDEGNMDKETVYYSHGFNTCHSQIIRLNPHLTETK